MEGIAQIRQGQAAYRATGAEYQQTYILTLLVEAYGKVEQAEEGLSILAEALATTSRTGEHWLEAELYRLKGELTLSQWKVESHKWKEEKQQVKGKSHRGARGWELGASQAPSLKPLAPSGVEQEVEGYFLKAIEIARRQQAKSWELRATTSLAWLWQRQGKCAEARQMLAEIYDWFTEGFDTKDLQEAKALLEELGH